MISRRESILSIYVRNIALFGGKLEIESSNAIDLGKLLQTASDKLFEGETFSGKAGSVSVTSIEHLGQKVIKVMVKPKGIFTPSYILVDGDNAVSLARLLRRAKQVSDWLKSRVTALQPSGP